MKIVTFAIPCYNSEGYMRNCIESLLPGGEEPAGAPAQVTSEQVRALTPDMTREEVLALLGCTQDGGSGIYASAYEVDGKYLLRIPFAGDIAQVGCTGK